MCECVCVRVSRIKLWEERIRGDERRDESAANEYYVHMTCALSKVLRKNKIMNKQDASF